MLDRDEIHDDEIVQEDDAQDMDLELEAEEELTKDKLKSLRQKLKDSESEKMTALEEAARIKADFLNSKRRLEEQFTKDKERIVEKVVMDFIPLVDSFETALLHAQHETGEWKKGIEAMHGQFLSILRSYDITEIDAIGKTFDPYEHEAVGEKEGENGEAPHTVLQVVQKGYKRNDTIIRPAKVLIAA